MAALIRKLFFSISSKIKAYISLRRKKASKLLRSCMRLFSTTATSRSTLNRSPTTLEKKLETSISRLGPTFTSAEVEAILCEQSDPDLAFSIFCWTSRRLDSCHISSTYETMLHISVTTGRFSDAEYLVSDILRGGLHPDLALFNSAIRFCCSRHHLLPSALKLYRLMFHPNAACRPNLETYSLLLDALLSSFGKPPVCYIYQVRSLAYDMKALGVAPDIFTYNLILKAYTICLDMDAVIELVKEMQFYGCEPDQHSFGYVTQCLFQKGLVDPGFSCFKEMRAKGFIPTKEVYTIVISSLAKEWQFDACINALFDMLGNSLVPDLSTYKTILDCMCSGGRTKAAYGLLNFLGKKREIDSMTYSVLLSGIRTSST